MTTSAKATNSNNNNESSTTTTTTTNSNDNNIKLELWPTSSPGTEMQQPTTTTQQTPAQAPQLSVNSTSAPPQALSSSTNRVMQADEDFNIRFVNLVRLHRCLYDKKVPEYRNRDNQEKAWVLISQETRESVIHCKERWRNLRACLSRYIKQQSGSEPQHKPYYLTEHMAFLLPFLKSARSSLESNNSLTALYQLSQDHQQQQQHNPLQMLSTASQMQQLNNGVQQKLEFKQSLSENDDEETIDAFDPVISASLGLQRINATNSGAEVTTGAASPALSDTASANTLQNFIPDVQLAESGPDLIYHPHTHAQSHQQHHGNHLHRRCDSRDYDACSSTAIKRIKTECEPTTSGQFYGIGGGGSSGSGGADGAEHADMEFFRSILPDLAALTPQQKRKFKIGILELIDEVVERYPSNSTSLDRSGSASSVIDNYGNGNGSMANGISNGAARASGRQQRRNSTRDSAWRK